MSPAPSRTRGTWLCAGCHASVRFRGAALAPRSPQARAGGGVGAEGQPRPRSPALLPPPDGVPRPPWPTSGSPLTRPPPPALPDLGALSAGGRPPSPTGAQPGAAPPGTARGGPGEGRCLCPPRCPGSAAPRWPLPAVPAASVPGRRRGLGRDAERGGLRWEDGLPGPRGGLHSSARAVPSREGVHLVAARVTPQLPSALKLCGCVPAPGAKPGAMRTRPGAQWAPGGPSRPLQGGGRPLGLQRDPGAGASLTVFPSPSTSPTAFLSFPLLGHLAPRPPFRSHVPLFV